MDTSMFEQYVRYVEKDRDSETPPILSVRLTATPQLFLTSPFYIGGSLHYTAPAGKKRPVTVEWNIRKAINNGELVLFQQSGDTWEHVGVDLEKKQPSHNETSSFDYFQNDTEARCGNYCKLPDKYYDYLEVGKNYALFWPGDRVRWWHHERGTIDSVPPDEGNVEEIVLPAANVLKFNVGERSEPWPGREEYEKTHTREKTNEAEWWKWRTLYCALPPDPLPLTEKDRILDAPKLTRIVSGPSKVSLKTQHDYTITVTTTYEADEACQNKPTTFLDNVFDELTDEYHYTLTLHTKNGPEEVDYEFCCGATWSEPDPDEPMLVAATAAICIKKHFHTLYPGQSMVEQFQVFKEGWPYKLFDKHEHHGMTYRFEGKIIQWWNWGTLEDHKDTIVRGLETSHNRRPKVVIPHSSFDFEVVE